MSLVDPTLRELLTAWSEADRAYQRADSLIDRWAAVLGEQPPAELHELQDRAFQLCWGIEAGLRVA